MAYSLTSGFRMCPSNIPERKQNRMPTETTTTDLYPSRHLDSPRILDRLDPVVYGEADDGPLTRGELESYERDGFLVLPRIFGPAEVELWRAELERMKADPAIAERPECIYEPDNDTIRSFFAIHELSPVFADVAGDRRLLEVARQILGGDVSIHQSRVNLKPPFDGRPFQWHSDFETWHTEDGMPRMRACSMFVALTDNLASNGPLMLIRGSHRRFVACSGETPDEHYKRSLRKQEIGVPSNEILARLAEEGEGIAVPTPRAGSVLLFDCNTLHASAGNLTPYPRHNLFFVYNHVENELHEPFCGTHLRPEFVASRHTRPLRPR